MPFTVKTISHPRWADAEHTRIDCMVRFEEIAETLPFTASPDDPAVHGREVFRLIMEEGKGGAVGAFVAPPAAPLSPLSRRQFWLAALGLGITKEAVRTLVESRPEIDAASALIEIDDAQEYERDHPLVAVLASALMLAPEQVDAAWQAALSA